MVKAAERSESDAGRVVSQYGIPIFLSQLIKTLEIEKAFGATNNLPLSDANEGPSESSAITEAATKHGCELSDHGYTIEQVVHDYSDLCKTITELAHELDEPIGMNERRTLKRCLDNAIANAVNAFSFQRRLINDDKVAQAINHRLGALVEELRIHNNAAKYAVQAIKSGQIGFNGATGYVLERSLDGMERILDRSFTDVRLVAGLAANHELIVLEDFIADIKTSFTFEALSRKCTFSAIVIGKGLTVEADRDLLFSALGNLLHNAFKFTYSGSKVALTVYAQNGHVLIDIQDHCGGLGTGNKEDLFLPFRRAEDKRSGIGLGLALTRRSVEASNGVLSVRDIPGSGCVSTITLPLCASPR